MNAALLLQGLGSAGFFASRAFLPAFATALAMRFAPEIGGLARVGLLSKAGPMPTWFTSDACLIILGVLSALEMLGDRSPEIRDFLREWAHTLKASMAALTFLGVVKVSDRALIDPMLRGAGLIDSAPAVLVGAATYFASVARSAAVGLVSTEDGRDDPIGIARVGRWVEDVWSVVGPWLLLALPLLTLALVAMAALPMAYLARRARRLEAKSIGACPHCGAAVHRAATLCPSCRRPVDRPDRVDWLGNPAEGEPADPASQRLDLVGVGRCPDCATTLDRRATCPRCGLAPLADPQFAADYLARLDRRIGPTALLCLLVGLVPLVGAMAGVLICRVRVVGPLGRYLSFGRGLATRWTTRVVGLGLIAFQWVPLLGSLTIPAVALLDHWAYRRSFARAYLPAQALASRSSDAELMQ